MPRNTLGYHDKMLSNIHVALSHHLRVFVLMMILIITSIGIRHDQANLYRRVSAMQTNNNHNIFLNELLKIRLIVGYLGEKNQYAWWSSSFFNPFSKTFLEPIFPKNGFLSQYVGVTAAASKLHDEYVNSGVFHLFRLPEIIEQDLYQILKNYGDYSILFNYTKAKEDALVILQSLAKQNPMEKEGPIFLGHITELNSVEELYLTAGIYHSAFQKNIKCYPYWAE